MSQRLAEMENRIRGDSFEQLLRGAEELLPRISEYMFEREVVDLLTNPFDEHFLHRYLAYVGELTKPLRVMSNDNPQQELFRVPAIAQSPNPTIGKIGGHGVTAEHYFRNLTREQELGGRRVPDLIRRFMSNITDVPNYRDAVILPIREILARYNRQMVAIPGIDTDIGTKVLTQEPQGGGSYGDDYED